MNNKVSRERNSRSIRKKKKATSMKSITFVIYRNSNGVFF